MKKEQINNFQQHLEWESIQWEIEITHLNSLKKNYNIPKDAVLRVFRDDEYKLDGILTGTVTNQNDLEYKIDGKHPEAGQLQKGDSIVGYDVQGNLEYKLESFFLKSFNYSFSGLPPNINFKSEISISSFQEQWIEDNRKPDTILDFYLTGKISLLFPRATDRAKEEKYSKSRHRIDPEVKEPEYISAKIHGPSRDYFFIETDEFNFIVQKVNSRFLPKWGNGIQIEYRTEFKSIPDNEAREAIAEIVGFVLGTHFLKIGESHLDANKNVVFKRAVNPWGDNVISKCESLAIPPIDLSDFNDWNKIERALIKIVPKYLNHRNDYGLSDVLWKYWIANELAIGTNLPVLSSSLESLSENYIEIKNLIKSYPKVEKKQYKELVRPELESLTEKLTSYDFSKRILDKIRNPYNIGIGEKLKLFFDDLELHFGNDSVENKALKARNKMTHSSLEDSEEERLKYIKLSKAYKSLVNRTILRVLEYDETYVDFYTTGYPSKDLSENI